MNRQGVQGSAPAAAAKAQQLPQPPWFFTGVTCPSAVWLTRCKQDQGREKGH